MITRLGLTGSVSLIFAMAASAAHAETAQLVSHPITLVSNSFSAEPRFDAAAHVDQAFDLIRNGKQAQAVQLFDRIIANADQRLAGDGRPRLCRDGGNAAGAVVVDAALCDAHFGKGFALIDMGRGDLAEAELLKATQMAPTNAHFANEYAELFKSRREWQQSYDLFAHAYSIADKNLKGPDAKVAARALRGMAFNEIEMGGCDEAEKLFQQSLTFDPANQVAINELKYIARKKVIGS